MPDLLVAYAIGCVLMVMGTACLLYLLGAADEIVDYVRRELRS